MRLVSVTSYTRRAPEKRCAITNPIHSRLQAEVANFDHVPVILEAALETALNGFRGEAIDMPDAGRAQEAM